MSRPKTNPEQESKEHCCGETLVTTRMKGLNDLYTSVFLEAYRKSGRIEKAKQEAAAACDAMEEFFS